MSNTPLRVFIMYAHEDKPVRDKLLKQFRPLVRGGAIDLWSDHEIKPGALWDEEIRTRLSTSDLIIMLVSDDFFDSDYIHNVEMVSALERHEKGEVRLVPVIARYCAWEHVPEIARLQVLPSSGKPVLSKGWDAEDQPYLDVVKGVQEAMKDLRKTQHQKKKQGKVPMPAPTPPDEDDPRLVRQKPVIYAALALVLVLFGVFMFKYGGDIFEFSKTAKRDTTQQVKQPPAIDSQGPSLPTETGVTEENPGKDDPAREKEKPIEAKKDVNPVKSPPTTQKPATNKKPEANKAAPPKEETKPYDSEYPPASDGMLRVKKGRLWGYKNVKTGQIIGWYDDAEDFYDGKAFVKKGSLSYYITKSGRKTD